MNNPGKRATRYFQANIGRCATCMRTSLAASIVAWGVFVAGTWAMPDLRAINLVLVIACGLTLLWTLHLITFAARTAAKLSRGADNETDVQPPAPERRLMLGTVLRAGAVTVAATMPLVIWPTRGFAFCGQCTVDRDCGSANSNWCCKNTAPVNAGYVCNECKKCV